MLSQTTNHVLDSIRCTIEEKTLICIPALNPQQEESEFEGGCGGEPQASSSWLQYQCVRNRLAHKASGGNFWVRIMMVAKAEG